MTTIKVEYEKKVRYFIYTLIIEENRELYTTSSNLEDWRRLAYKALEDKKEHFYVIYINDRSYIKRKKIKLCKTPPYNIPPTPLSPSIVKEDDDDDDNS